MNKEIVTLEETEAKKSWDAIFPEIYNHAIKVFNKHLPNHKLSFNKEDNLIVDETTGITLGPSIVRKKTIVKTREFPGFELFGVALIPGNSEEPDYCDVVELGQFTSYRDAVVAFAKEVFAEGLQNCDTNYWFNSDVPF